MLHLQHVANKTYQSGGYSEVKQHYTDTIFYQIELTAKYCKLMGAQVFEQYKTGVTVEEYSVLDTLLVQNQLCQRDLAKLILKNRANTGKLLDGLEKKGFIIRKLAVKNNRPVKLIEITKEGVEKVEEAANIIRPHYYHVKKQIDNSDIAHVGDLLKELRTILSDTLKIHI